jgi:hypothetical protein
MFVPPRLASFGARIGVRGLAFAILAALLAVQTVRIEGFKVWPISVAGWKARALKAEQTISDYPKAQEEALRRAQAAKAKAEADYRNLAERIDDEAEQVRGDAMADAERYIAANRVRAAGRCSAGGPAAPAPDHSPGNSEEVRNPPELDGAIAVRPEDIRICTVNTLQAEAARDWALGLEAAGE